MVKNITKRYRVQEIQDQTHIGVGIKVEPVQMNEEITELKTTSTTKNKQTKKLKKNE